MDPRAGQADLFVHISASCLGGVGYGIIRFCLSCLVLSLLMHHYHYYYYYYYYYYCLAIYMRTWASS